MVGILFSGQIDLYEPCTSGMEHLHRYELQRGSSSRDHAHRQFASLTIRAPNSKLNRSASGTLD